MDRNADSKPLMKRQRDVSRSPASFPESAASRSQSTDMLSGSEVFIYFLSVIPEKFLYISFDYDTPLSSISIVIYYSHIISVSSSLVAPPYRGEGV